MFKGLYDTSQIQIIIESQALSSPIKSHTHCLNLKSQASTQEPPDAEATDADVLVEGVLEVDASSSR